MSQPAIPTIASYWWARTINSIESAITSLLIKDDFIPSWPIAIPSLTAIVLNSRGVAPPSVTPCFAFCARDGRCMLHGVASLPVWQTPINDLNLDLYLGN